MRTFFFTVLLFMGALLFSCSSNEDNDTKPKDDEQIDTSSETPNINKEPSDDPTITPPPNPKDETTNQIISEGLKDFKDIPVPPSPGEGMTWEYQNYFSDDFNYDFNSSSRVSFGVNNQWENWYHSNWNGPGLTQWDEDNVLVKDGNLRLITSRVPGEIKTYNNGSNKVEGKATRLGCISSNDQIVFPVYIETRAKIPNTVNACAAWLLSPDATQEIDFMEAWGAENDNRNTGNGNGTGRNLWESVHLSHHVFIRNPFTDYQPKTDTHFKRSDVKIWNDDYHRFGVYWVSPTELHYYVDGKLARSIEGMDNSNGKDGIDPKGYTGVVLKVPGKPNDGAVLDSSGKPVINLANRTGLNKPMNIIIDMEDQDWRSARGATLTDTEILNNKEDLTLKVDWIRVYKPVNK